MGDQISFFDGKQKFFLDRPIRLIELFGGIGSQAKALRNIGADFEHYRFSDIDKYAVKSYNAIHGTDFDTSDITKMRGGDLGINECVKYIHLLTYSFP
jgi:DNA (cytosine-5)-methyltransferase 1